VIGPNWKIPFAPADRPRVRGLIGRSLIVAAGNTAGIGPRMAFEPMSE